MVDSKEEQPKPYITVIWKRFSCNNFKTDLNNVCNKLAQS